jgi:hypothetical protein
MKKQQLKISPDRCSDRQDVWYCWFRYSPPERLNYEPVANILKPRTEAGKVWKKRFELAAWRYELARRHARALGKAPWTRWDQLSQHEQNDLAAAFGAPQVSVVIPNSETAFHLVEEVENFRRLELWIDTEAADDALKTDFLIEVRKRIPQPTQQPTKPKRSWRWIEILDVDFYKEGELTKHERDILPKVKRAAKEVYEFMATYFSE